MFSSFFKKGFKIHFYYEVLRHVTNQNVGIPTGAVRGPWEPQSVDRSRTQGKWFNTQGFSTSITKEGDTGSWVVSRSGLVREQRVNNLLNWEIHTTLVVLDDTCVFRRVSTLNFVFLSEMSKVCHTCLGFPFLPPTPRKQNLGVLKFVLVTRQDVRGSKRILSKLW